MFDGRSVQPMNSCKIFDMLVSEENSLREKAAVQYELLWLSETGLERFPSILLTGLPNASYSAGGDGEIVVTETRNLLATSIDQAA